MGNAANVLAWLSWSQLGGVLGLAGGLAAVAAFVASRFDMARAYAAKVYPLVTFSLSGPARPGEYVSTRFKIVNNGSLPAFSVGVSAWDWGRRRVTWRFRRHHKWMTGRRIVGRVYNTVTPNNETAEDDLPGLPDWGPAGENPPVMLVFRDGLGRWWVRWPDGRLTRVAPSLFQLEQAWRRRRDHSRQESKHRRSGPATPHTPTP